MNTSTNRPAFSYGQFSVLRRYSDFEWLLEQLGTAFPGVILPAIPEKQAVGRFSPDFVEQRRRGLERFLNKLSLHPTLVESQYLISFLTADDVAFNIAKSTVRQEIDEKSNGGMVSWFNKAATTVANVATNKTVNLEKTASDLKIEEILEYLNQLENHMSSVSKGTSLVVKRNRDMANALFEFGQAFTWLGQSEGDFLGTALVQIGNAADQLSVTSTEFAEAESLQLEEPIQEYFRLVGSVKSTIFRRQNKKSIYINAISDLESKQTSYTKALSVAGKEDIAAKKQKELELAQQYVESTKNDLDAVTDVLLNEFEKFKSEKAADIKTLLANFAKMQGDYHRKAEKIWGDILPQLMSVADVNVDIGVKSQSDAAISSSNATVESNVAASTIPLPDEVEDV